MKYKDKSYPVTIDYQMYWESDYQWRESRLMVFVRAHLTDMPDINTELRKSCFLTSSIIEDCLQELYWKILNGHLEKKEDTNANKRI